MVVAKDPVVPAEPKLEDHASEDEKATQVTEEYMRKYYAAQPKVSVKCAEDQWVQVNGYTFVIKKGERVMVPEDIFKILDEAGRI